MVRVVFRRTGNGQATLPELIAPLADRLPWRAHRARAPPRSSRCSSGSSQAASWQTYLLWLHGGAFGVDGSRTSAATSASSSSRLPAYQALVGAAMAIVVLAGVLAAVVFWLHGALDFRRPDELDAAARCSASLSLLLALFLLVKAVGYWLGRYELLLAPYGRGVRRRLHGRAT